jgi:heme-degrading monooxygenase HmoA
MACREVLYTELVEDVSMIARIWHGRTSAELGTEYEQFLRDRAIADYRSTVGNRGALVLRHDTPSCCHFLTVSLWESLDVIRAFAGEAIETAKYYDEDARYLLEYEPTAMHYEVHSDNPQSPREPKPTPSLEQSPMVARLWRGIVPNKMAEAYLQYLFGFGIRDYETFSGYRSGYVLRRTEGAQTHIVLLSFWSSRQAITAYAGSNIDRAHYYPYDLECLVDPSPNVEHYDMR